jgi:SAM-dependent methyltransferase
MIDTGHLYGDLSSYYDLFCAGVDYSAQCEFAHRAFQCFAATSAQRYLDLACGTGPHLQHMQSFGYQCTGLDNSIHMLEMAKLRCPQARFIHADMAALDMDNCADLVSCFLYSIHYNSPLVTLHQTLAAVYKALVPGGIFVFDTVDVRGITSQHFVSSELLHQDHQLRFKSGWTYAGQGDVMDLHLTVVDEFQGQIRQWQDVHQMSAFTIVQLQQWLQDSGFEVTLLEHDFSRLQQWQGQNFNVLVVARKPALE